MVCTVATEIHLCPTMFHTATVRPKRRRCSLLYHTTLRINKIFIRPGQEGNIEKCNLTLAMSPTYHSNNTLHALPNC